jgi:hypothetical protein
MSDLVSLCTVVTAFHWHSFWNHLLMARPLVWAAKNTSSFIMFTWMVYRYLGGKQNITQDLIEILVMWTSNCKELTRYVKKTVFMTQAGYTHLVNFNLKDFVNLWCVLCTRRCKICFLTCLMPLFLTNNTWQLHWKSRSHYSKTVGFYFLAE